MYGWIFRHLPGPVWLKVIFSLLLLAAALAALMTWVFPWLSQFSPFNAATIESARFLGTPD